MRLKTAGLTASTEVAGRLLRAKARGRGLDFTVTSGRRSRAKQQALWDARASNRYPVAKPGTSDHERGIAFDAVAIPRDRQRELGHLWRRMGGEWSKRDEIHFVWRKALPNGEAPLYTTA